MTVEQKHDPYQPYPVGMFNAGCGFCMICEEWFVAGDLIVPGLNPQLGRNARAHYLCAVWADDNDYVSRDSRAYPTTGLDAGEKVETAPRTPRGNAASPPASSDAKSEEAK